MPGGSIKEFIGDDLNIVGCWALNGHAIDESRNNLHGTPNNILAYSGRFRNAYYFNGTDANIDIGHNKIGPVLNGCSSATVCLWVYLFSLPEDNSTEYLSFSNIAGSGISGCGLSMRNNSGVTYFRVDGRSTQTDAFKSLLSVTKAKTHQWFFIIGTLDYLSDSMTIHVNGVLDNVAPSVGFESTVYTHQSVTEGYHDRLGAGATANLPFHGVLCDALYIRRKLSPCEIYQYYTGVTGRPPKKYWAYSDIPTTVIPIFMNHYRQQGIN